VAISLDSPDPEDNDEMRGRLTPGGWLRLPNTVESKHGFQLGRVFVCWHEELGDERGLGAEEQIRSARRGKHVPVSYPGVLPPDELPDESPANGGWAVLGSNQRPPACKAGALAS